MAQKVDQHETEKKGKHPGGRPTKYKPEYADLAYKCCLLHATDAKIAEFLGVNDATVNRWKLEHPEFCEALKNGKERADAEIARSLYQRAKGYSHETVKILTVSDGNGQGSHVEKVPYTEHYPPDTAAAIIWLKNRQPKQWRDKQDVEVGVTDDLAELIRETHGSRILPTG